VEVAVAISAEWAEWLGPRRPRRTIEELLAEKNSKPFGPEDLDRPDPFETDEEHELFLAWLYESRRSNCV